jgi:hypothetical protein
VTLLSRGASEAHREVAALKQQQMNLKLEAGRLTRYTDTAWHKELPAYCWADCCMFLCYPTCTEVHTMVDATCCDC